MNTYKRSELLKQLLKSIFILLLFTSCVNQNTSEKQTGSLTDTDVDFLLGDTIDTRQRLKFTSGLRSIFEDSKGDFWFGSHQEGVCRFDGETFTYFTTKEGLSDNQVRTIQEDQAGNIWFSTGNGVTSFDGVNFIIHTKQEYLGVKLGASHSAKAKWEKKSNDLWFHGDRSEGVYRYDGEKLSYLPFPTPENRGDENYHVTSIAKGKSGSIWFATYIGLFGLDRNSTSIEPSDFTIIDEASLGLNEQTGRIHVRAVFEDSKGNLWIGNNGVGVFLIKGDSTIHFTKQHGLGKPKGLPRGEVWDMPGSLARVFSIGEDKDGNIWFGTADAGVWRYSPSASLKTGVQSLTNYTKKDGLTDMHVWDIYNDKRGELWLALGDGSVCKFNGKSFDRIY